MADDALQVHGVAPNGLNGDGQFFFASAKFIKKLEELYALPQFGFPQAENAPSRPHHTLDRRFDFAAEKYWTTVFKIDRVAELIPTQRERLRDFSPCKIPVADVAGHLSALTDLPIYLEPLIVYQVVY